MALAMADLIVEPKRPTKRLYNQATLPSKWILKSPMVVAVPLSDTVAVPFGVTVSLGFVIGGSKKKKKKNDGDHHDE